MKWSNMDNIFCFPIWKKSLMIKGKFLTYWNIGMIKPICKKKGDRRWTPENLTAEE